MTSKNRKSNIQSIRNLFTGHWMRFKNIFSYFIHHLLSCISMIESVFLFSKKQWQIYLSCTMVNANDIVLDITKNSIQPIEPMIFLRVITSSITVILSFIILNVVLPSVFNVLSFDRTSDCGRKAFTVSLSSFVTALNLMNCGYSYCFCLLTKL